jgi:hypothetical protein
MSHPLSSPRRLVRPAALALASLLVGSAAVALAASPGSSRSTATTAQAPPATISAIQISGRPGTLRPGTIVRSADLGLRVFADGQHGVALADDGDAQYAAATVNGGRTWRIDSPALHVNAAQAPFAVLDIGAANQHTFFAFGGGQVVDVTSDAGKHWWQAPLGEVVMAVVAGGSGRLIAFAQNAAGVTGTTAVNAVYVSQDGGRHWHIDNRVGAS